MDLGTAQERGFQALKVSRLFYRLLVVFFPRLGKSLVAGSKAWENGGAIFQALENATVCAVRFIGAHRRHSSSSFAASLAFVKSCWGGAAFCLLSATSQPQKSLLTVSRSLGAKDGKGAI
jgi:hypothetical protein